MIKMIKAVVILCLVGVVSASLDFDADFDKRYNHIDNFRDNQAKSELFNLGTDYLNSVSSTFNDYNSPTNSITYDNPVIDSLNSAPIIGSTFESLSTGIRIGESIGEKIARDVLDNFDTYKENVNSFADSFIYKGDDFQRHDFGDMF